MRVAVTLVARSKVTLTHKLGTIEIKKNQNNLLKTINHKILCEWKTYIYIHV